jgi:DNA-binding IclR family transcriptional regulator
VRVQGYALGLEEYAEGLHCISAPVREQTGRVTCALGITGPCSRIEGERLVQLIPMVVRAAQALSRNLGFVEEHSLRVAVLA